MDRRSFLKNSLVGAGVAAALRTLDLPLRAQDRPKAVLKISSQEGRLPGRSLKEKVENLVKYGGVGLELGAGFNPQDVQAALAGTNVKVSAICAADGPYIVADEAQRRRAVDNAKRILEKAGEVGSTGVIMVPAFNGRKDQLWGGEAHKVLVDQLLEMGETAAKANTRILLEPLNKGEAWFLRNLSYAAAICRDAEELAKRSGKAETAKGIGMMGDFYHMCIEETSDMGAFISAGKYLHHVHLASRRRNLPGQDDRSFVDGFRGLKMIGYQDFMSLECGCQGNPEEEIPKSFRFLEKQWEEATV